MIRDITIGQYYPQSSEIHRLDPRVKLLGTVLFVLSVFLYTSISNKISITQKSLKFTSRAFCGQFFRSDNISLNLLP